MPISNMYFLLCYKHILRKCLAGLKRTWWANPNSPVLGPKAREMYLLHFPSHPQFRLHFSLSFCPWFEFPDSSARTLWASSLLAFVPSLNHDHQASLPAWPPDGSPTAPECIICTAWHQDVRILKSTLVWSMCFSFGVLQRRIRITKPAPHPLYPTLVQREDVFADALCL